MKRLVYLVSVLGVLFSCNPDDFVLKVESDLDFDVRFSSQSDTSYRVANLNVASTENEVLENGFVRINVKRPGDELIKTIFNGPWKDASDLEFDIGEREEVLVIGELYLVGDEDSVLSREITRLDNRTVPRFLVIDSVYIDTEGWAIGWEGIDDGTTYLKEITVFKPSEYIDIEFTDEITYFNALLGYNNERVYKPSFKLPSYEVGLDNNLRRELLSFTVRADVEFVYDGSVGFSSFGRFSFALSLYEDLDVWRTDPEFKFQQTGENGFSGGCDCSLFRKTDASFVYHYE